MKLLTALLLLTSWTWAQGDPMSPQDGGKRNGPAAADAEKPPEIKPTGRKFQSCVWPYCTNIRPRRTPVPDGKKDPAAKKKAPEEIPDQTYGADPLTDAIMKSQLEGNGIVSAVRLKPEQTGTDKDQILYHGKGSDLRDAVGGLSLPVSSVPVTQTRLSEKGTADWNDIDLKTKSSKQANSMKDETPSLQGNADDSRQGLDRMWGAQEKAPNTGE